MIIIEPPAYTTSNSDSPKSTSYSDIRNQYESHSLQNTAINRIPQETVTIMSLSEVTHDKIKPAPSDTSGSHFETLNTAGTNFIVKSH